MVVLVLVLSDELCCVRRGLMRLMPAEVKMIGFVLTLHAVQLPGESRVQVDQEPSAQTEQLEQLDEARRSEYVAALHQRHSVVLLLRFNPISHCRNVPMCALYFPAGHAEQGPPSGPMYPCKQEQSLRL